MKLASLEGGPNGRLFVVSDDLGWCVSAAEIAPDLGAALADWDRCEPLLRGVARFLNRGAQRYRRLERVAGELALSTPAVTRAVAVTVGAVAQGAGRAEAVAAIRLVQLQLDTPLGAQRSVVAVTPDTLGEAWRDGRLVVRPSLELDAALVVATPMTLDFAAAVVEAARTGAVAEGAVIALSDHRLARLRAIAHDAALRYELRDSLSRSVFGAVELRAPALERALEAA